MRTVALFLPAMLAVTLAACQAERPEMWHEHAMPPPEISWSEATMAAQPDLAPGEILSYEKACEIALAHHPDVARAGALVDAANARVGQSLSAYFPQLRLNVSFPRSTSNPSSDSGSSDGSRLGWTEAGKNFRSGLDVSQLVFDFGKTRATRLQAKHNLAATREDAVAVALSVLVETRTAYLTLLAEQALEQVSRQTVENFEKHLREVETFVRVGRRTEADTAKARVDLGEARLDALRARNRVASARLSLNRAMGLEKDPGYRVSETPPGSHFDLTPDEAADQARLSRPELRSAHEKMSAAQQNLRKVWARHFPSLSFGASFDTSGDDFPLTQNWSLAPSLEWDIFSGFRISREVAEAEALWRAARAELAEAEQTVFFEVQTALIRHGESRERTALAKETVASAQESLRLISGRYAVGRAALLEQTDAELALARARAEEIQARYDTEKTAAELLRALGIVSAGERK